MKTSVTLKSMALSLMLGVALAGAPLAGVSWAEEEPAGEAAQQPPSGGSLYINPGAAPSGTTGANRPVFLKGGTAQSGGQSPVAKAPPPKIDYIPNRKKKLPPKIDLAALQGELEKLQPIKMTPDMSFADRLKAREYNEQLRWKKTRVVYDVESQKVREKQEADKKKYAPYKLMQQIPAQNRQPVQYGIRPKDEPAEKDKTENPDMPRRVFNLPK